MVGFLSDRFFLHCRTHEHASEILASMQSNSPFKSPEFMMVATVVLMVILISISGMVAPPPSVSIEAFLANETSLHSQVNEELLIRHFFNDERGGFYLDVGCAFAKKNSTTYFLEANLDWTGIGIDAVESYREYWELLRPRSKFIHTAVSDTSGETVIFYQAKHPGLSSLDEDWSEQFGMEDPVPVEIETITLNDLLEREKVEWIDLLSMDIEGAEPLALAGFDIERFAPRLVCIEVNENSESATFIRTYFEKHGYELIEEYVPHDIANWYYRPKG